MRSSSLLIAGALGAFVACSNPNQPPPQVSATGATPKSSAPPAVHTPPALRLPQTVRPQSYALTMHMSPTEERITGQVEVELKISEPTSVIWLHAGDNLNVLSAHLSGAFPAKSMSIERGGEEMVGIAFSENLPAGAYKLNLSYDGKLPSREGRGAYRQEERGDWYIFTQFESISARRAFPCFDEPGFKAPFRVTLEVPKDQLAFANTPQTSEAPSQNGWKTVSFAPSKPLPSYLVAFAVGPFEIVDAGKAGEKQVPVRIIVPKGKSSEAAYAAKTTAEVVNRLEKYFGIPYPYEKVDHIAVPMKGGAMENPGLITYGTGTILGKPEDKSIRLERGYLHIAAHELGHIWFGDFVTTAWWDDIWLNEAFATWISAKIVDQWHPEWDGSVSRVQAKNGVMGTDSLVNTRRIRQPIESKHDIFNAFDGITYQKGGAVITMFESFVGEEPFRKGVHEYLLAHAHGNATATDFLKEVGAHTGKADIFATAFATFLDQPGVPIVSAELSCEKNAAPKLVLSQQRYLPQGSSGSSDQSWKLPVCASYPGGKSCMMMTTPSAELPLTDAKTCPAWVNPNAGSNGYYRVLYKGDLFSRLMKAPAKALSTHERLGVMGDALALVRSGGMQEGEVLALVPALVQEGDRHLVGQTIGLVGGLSDRLVPEELQPNYRRLVNKLYAPRAKQLGWQPKAGEDDGTRLLRPGLLGLVAKDEQNALATEARKLTEAWLTDKKAIDHDLVGTVLGTAARGGDVALWDKLRAEAKKTQDRKERNQLLGAMSAFKDPKIVEKNLEVVMSDEFDPRESVTLLFGAASDSKTRQRAYDFAKTNFDRIVARMPPEWGASLTGVASGFCDAEHRADVEAFFKDKIARFNGGPRTLAQTLEGISLCQAQHSARQASVTAFLKKY
jgi:cytosol alanyl aminopeptidase